MGSRRYCVTAASVLAMLVAGSAALAQSQTLPTVEIETTSVAVGIGGQKGKGVLKLPNLGKGCEVPFTVEGLGAGLKVGISKLTAKGAVKSLTNIANFPGKYLATQAETTVIVGGGVLNLKNRANNVAMELKSTSRGVNLGIGAEGFTIKLVKTPTEAPRDWVVYFGFNKHWIGKESRATLAQVVNAWKCRYVTFELVGHTDTTGKEGYNKALSGKRASSVRDFLIKAGVAPGRITTRAAGKKEPLKLTGQGVRDRANRAVVLHVE